jgi:hypothetical protein
MLDSCNAAINEGYKNHTVIKIEHKDIKRIIPFKTSTKSRLQSFLQRADYKGKFLQRADYKKLKVQNFNKHVSGKRGLYKSLQLVTLYSGT